MLVPGFCFGVHFYSCNPFNKPIIQEVNISCHCKQKETDYLDKDGFECEDGAGILIQINVHARTILLPLPLHHCLQKAMGSFKRHLIKTRGVSLVAQLVKSLPAMQVTPVQFLGWEDPLKNGQATHSSILGLPQQVAQTGKESSCNTGDLSSIPGLGRSPGGGYSNSLQSSCLRTPMDRGAWRATVHGVAKSWAGLSDQVGKMRG